MDPLISVIVPVFNVEMYLHKCIDSIVNQTYKNLEIILVNDGSTDKSSFICDKYKQDGRVKVHHKEHGGVSDARNVGLSHVTGEFIGFLDGDDYIHEEFYTYLYKLITEYNSEIAQCEYLKVSPDGAKLISETKLNDEFITQISGRSMLENLRNSKYYPSNTVLGNKLYHESLWKGLQFKTGRLHEDEYIIHEIYYKTSTVCLSSRPLYFYVQRDNSIMRIAKVKRYDDIIGVYEDRISYFNSLGEDLFKNQAIQYEMLTLIDFYINFNSQNAFNQLNTKKQYFLSNNFIAKKYKILLSFTLINKYFGMGLMNASNFMKKLKKQNT